jgi:hypothetical protein
MHTISFFHKRQNVQDKCFDVFLNCVQNLQICLYLFFFIFKSGKIFMCLVTLALRNIRYLASRV